jgi:hypothetical protein
MWLNRKVKIILEFRFAIFDQGNDGEILTRRRKDAKGFCQTSFGCQLVSSGHTAADASQLCAFAPLRLGVKTVKAIKVAMAKNHLCKSLMANGVKPVSNRVKPSRVLTGGGSPSAVNRVIFLAGGAVMYNFSLYI